MSSNVAEIVFLEIRNRTPFGTMLFGLLCILIGCYGLFFTYTNLADYQAGIEQAILIQEKFGQKMRIANLGLITAGENLVGTGSTVNTNLSGGTLASKAMSTLKKLSENAVSNPENLSQICSIITMYSEEIDQNDFYSDEIIDSRANIERISSLIKRENVIFKASAFLMLTGLLFSYIGAWNWLTEKKNKGAPK